MGTAVVPTVPAPRSVFFASGTQGFLILDLSDHLSPMPLVSWRQRNPSLPGIDDCEQKKQKQTHMLPRRGRRNGRKGWMMKAVAERGGCPWVTHLGRLSAWELPHSMV